MWLCQRLKFRLCLCHTVYIPSQTSSVCRWERNPKCLCCFLAHNSDFTEVCYERTRLWPCVEGNPATDCYLIYSLHVILDIPHWDKWMTKQQAVCPLVLQAVAHLFGVLDPFFSQRLLAIREVAPVNCLPVISEVTRSEQSSLGLLSPARQPGQLKHRNRSLSHCCCLTLASSVVNAKWLEGNRWTVMQVHYLSWFTSSLPKFHHKSLID